MALLALDTPLPILANENALELICKRYAHKGPQYPLCTRIRIGIGEMYGKPCDTNHETPEMVFQRISMGRSDYFEMLARLLFLPNSPTIFNYGTGAGSFSACFVFHVEDSMVGIMDVARKAAMVQKFGGGVGYYLGNLRAKNSPIASTHGYACGPVAVFEVYNEVAKMVTQGGKRDGAQMAILPWDHPDIQDFIKVKDKDPQNYYTFNISVSATDAFMSQAIDEPHSEEGKLFWQICESAWKTGDPGVYFFDAAERGNPTPWLGRLLGTNPCLLGSTRMLTRRGLVSIQELGDTEVFTPSGWSPARSWVTGTKSVVQIVLSNGQRITATPDHKFVLGEIKEEARHLLGEGLEPFVGDGDWDGDTSFSEEDLVRLGFLQGDGSGTADGGMYVHLGRNDGDVREIFEGFKDHGERRRYISANDPLLGEANRLGMSFDPLPSRSLPTGSWLLSPDGMRSFLKGLYSANGSVVGTSRVTLKSTCLDLVTGVQEMLLALGFRPYITTNHPSDIKWPNGTYTSRRSYDLNLAGSEGEKFKDEIGFLQTYKMDRIKPVGRGRRLLPTVVAIEQVGQAEVWDFNVDDPSHVGWAAGFLASNCGEVPLLDNGSCNLGSIDLSKFVNYSSIDWTHLREVAALATEYLDDILEANVFPDPAITDASYETRKLGLGVMGWADTLALLHIPYDTDEAVALGGEVMSLINAVARDTSESLGEEKGAYPGWEKGVEWRDQWKKDHPELELLPLYEERRNATLTCIAPTGSISILAGCSSGIEPHIALEWERRMGDGTVLNEQVPVLDRLNGFRPKGAMEIGEEWHVRHQAEFQKHVDLATSKTINLEEDATVNDIHQAYSRAWKMGSKGITIYRDKSRGGEPEDQVLTPKVQVQVPEIHLNGNGSKSAAINGRTRLPDERNSVTHHFQIGEHDGYVTVGLFDDGRPGEIFMVMSKEGSTLRGLMDAFATAISIGLQHGVPLETFIKKFRQTSFEPYGLTTNPEIRMASSVIDYVFSWLALRFGTEKATTSPSGSFCPECGGPLAHEESCVKCVAGCGYSRC